MRMSAKAEYAVRAMTQLASVDGGGVVKTDDLAKAQGIPAQFLVDILSELRTDRLVRSHRGRDGGYELARPATEISIADVLRCIDGPLASVRDIGLGDLPYTGPTQALTDVWRALRASMRSVLEKTTLADVAGGHLPDHVDGARARLPRAGEPARTPKRVSDAVIAGDRIALRTPLLDDAEALFATVTSDPGVTRYLSWRPHRSVEETRGVITGLFNVGIDHTWLIALRDTGELVGQIGYLATEPHAVQVGYALSRQFWGRGLAGEALRLLVDHLEGNPALYRVAAYVHPDNLRSARVLERAGFSPEGRLVRRSCSPAWPPNPWMPCSTEWRCGRAAGP